MYVTENNVEHSVNYLFIAIVSFLCGLAEPLKAQLEPL